ncbi:MAG: hypothetical protein R3250_17135 [Melioribacteraceae bacterium]|nr:hypothetical protein [Melioribacteraceae bacterium]
MICSVCSGELVEKDNVLKCTSCGRTKNIRPQDRQAVHEVDMNDDTKDLDVIMG